MLVSKSLGANKIAITEDTAILRKRIKNDTAIVIGAGTPMLLAANTINPSLIPRLDGVILKTVDQLEIHEMNTASV